MTSGAGARFGVAVSRGDKYFMLLGGISKERMARDGLSRASHSQSQPDQVSYSERVIP